MTRPAGDANVRWLGVLLAALAAVLVTLFGAGTTAAPATASAAQTRVGAPALVAQVVVGPHGGIGAGQRLGNDHPAYVFALATGVAAEAAGAAEGADAAATTAAEVLQDPAALEGLTPSQIDDLARNAGYDILPGKAGAANPATRYYLPGTNNSVGFRVLPGGVAGQAGIKGGAYLKFFGGNLGGLRIPLGSP